MLYISPTINIYKATAAKVEGFEKKLAKDESGTNKIKLRLTATNKLVRIVK